MHRYQEKRERQQAKCHQRPSLLMTTMAYHLSAVQEVLGLPGPDVLLLEQHDEDFFRAQPGSESESS